MIQIPRLCALALAALLAVSASAANNIRDAAKRMNRGSIVLLYGSDWSPAGRAVLKTLESSAFKLATSGRYDFAAFDDPDTMTDEIKKRNAFAEPGNLGSGKLPAIFVSSSAGECFFAFDNVPMDISAQELAARILKADARRVDAEKLLDAAAKEKDLAAAELAGSFLEKMEPQLGGIARLKGPKSYERAWKLLLAQDPRDETGWRRRFEMGDGLGLVTKATGYAEKKDFEAGEAFIAEENAKPAKHLTVEQRQCLMMLPFALYRRDETRRDANLAILRKVADLDYMTIWGTAALGWMHYLKAPPLSTYWGWQPGDLASPQFSLTVHFGVKESFPERGRYTVCFRRAGNEGRLSIASLALVEDGRTLLALDAPSVSADGLETTFAFDWNPEFSDMVTDFVVKGTADAAAAGGSGTITIHREILRPRRSAAEAAKGR